MRTTRNQFHGQMRSRTPAKPCLIATFLLRFQRLFNAAIHALRMRVERTFAWEDKFKRLLLRFERVPQRHYGMKVLAYTLINLREFCGT